MKGDLVLLDWLQNSSFLFFPSISSSAHLGIPPEGSGKKVCIALFLISYIPSPLYNRWTWFAPQCVFLREVPKRKGQITAPVMWKAGKELAAAFSLMTIRDVFCICSGRPGALVKGSSGFDTASSTSFWRGQPGCSKAGGEFWVPQKLIRTIRPGRRGICGAKAKSRVILGAQLEIL